MQARRGWNKTRYAEIRAIQLTLIFRSLDAVSHESWDADGWGTKFGMIKCRTTYILEFQNYEY